MANQVCYPNHGGNAQWGPSHEEIYLQNMHSGSGINHPPHMQYRRQYAGMKSNYEEFPMQGEIQYQYPVMSTPSTQFAQFDQASQPNLLGHGFQNISTCPMRSHGIAPAVDNTAQYYQNTARPNAYNIQTSNQHWCASPNSGQGPVHLTQASAIHATNSHFNVPSPQTMANGTQGSQVMYSVAPCQNSASTPIAQTCTRINNTPHRNSGGVVAAESEVNAADMNEMADFARSAKKRRILLGLTQENVGDGLGALHNKAFSQTTICRFEAGHLSVSNMRKLKPILSKWFDEIETNPDSREIVNRREKPKNTVKRKRRTSFDALTKRYLELFYVCCSRPSTKEIKRIARVIHQECKVVRVWFCNQRQKEKREQNKKAKEEASMPNPTISPTVNENCAMTPMAAMQPYTTDVNGSNFMMYVSGYNNEQLL